MIDNFLITTGGTGGHVIPAMVICDHLEKNNVTICTDRRGLKYLNKELYRTEIINTPKLNNRFLLPINFFRILYLTFKSFFLLKNKKIKKIFCTGGYMSLPLILAARILRITIYLIEPNQVLGRANRFFLKFCKKIFCYSSEIKNFPEQYKDKIIRINPLVKKQIYELSSKERIKQKFTILVVGGSQGAEIFDNNIKDEILKIAKKNSVRVIHQTNEKNYLSLSDFYKKKNIENKIFTFDKNFSNLMHESDLCITRAGASTLAELSVLNIPFIAIPLPTSKDNHQFENANFYKRRDCCWLVEQNNFEKKIEEALVEIFEKKSVFFKKKENLKKLNYQNTWINVNQKILGIVNEN
tara:strand:+ start:30 stop:1091 length:1062 start_codon:yes stop_codon:yes gene_type:complete